MPTHDWLAVRFLNGPDRGREHRFADILVSVGRDPSNNLPIAWSSHLSRRHLELRPGDNSIIIRDCGSTAGTSYQGSAINQIELRGKAPKVLDLAGGVVQLQIRLLRETQELHALPWDGSNRVAVVRLDPIGAAPRRDPSHSLLGPPLAADIEVRHPVFSRSQQLLSRRIVVGRSRRCDVVLDDRLDAVSREHVAIESLPHQIVVSDLGSSNGTYYNGYPIDVLVVALDTIYELQLGRDGPTLTFRIRTTARVSEQAAPTFSEPSSHSQKRDMELPDAAETTIVTVSDLLAVVSKSPPSPPPQESSPPLETTSPAIQVPPDVTAPAWALAYSEAPIRRLFLHLAEHGSLNETEAASLLGGPRALRRFARRLEEYAAKAPFEVLIEVASGTKCYVRGPIRHSEAVEPQ